MNEARLIDVLRAQRNSALDQLADLFAALQPLRLRLAEVEKELEVMKHEGPRRHEP